MQENGSTRKRSLRGRGFAAFWALVATFAALSARPAQADVFAYVTNSGSGTVSVIDTATNIVVATVPVGSNPEA